MTEQRNAVEVRPLGEDSIKSALPSRDEVSARKAAPPTHGTIQEIEVTGVYNEGTLTHFIDTQLAGKMEKTNQIAGQLE